MHAHNHLHNLRCTRQYALAGETSYEDHRDREDDENDEDDEFLRVQKGAFPQTGRL